jgi:hypothetical protein
MVRIADDPLPRQLSPDVVARIHDELGHRGSKVLECLHTAAAFITQAHDDSSGLRLAESAAYNLREALDAVVADRPTPQGGVGAVVKAWRRYHLATTEPNADIVAARAELDRVLDQLEKDQERHTHRTLKLLEYIRDQTGIDPLPGEHDASLRYARLLARANSMLHDKGTVAGVAALYDDAVGWFVQLFTPPDARVDAIVALAAQPFSEHQLAQLRHLALNAHHLGLFLSRLSDPEWLSPLQDAGLIGPPRSGEPWPVTSLIGGAGSIEPSSIAAVLDRVLDESKREPVPIRQGIAREVIQCASRLGSDGHPVAKKVLARHGEDHWVQMIGFSLARAAHVEDPIQMAVAEAIVGREGRHDAAYHTRELLGLLTAGLTTANVDDRLALIGGKLRRLAEDSRMRYMAIDIAALDVDSDDLREPVLVLAQQFTATLPKLRELGVTTDRLLKQIESVPGEFGQRLHCRVLAGATDIDRSAKIEHIASRLKSETATGDDRDLIADILSTPLSGPEVKRWRAALGTPSPAEGEALGTNWPKAWRWATVLPEGVLDGWQDAIAAVTSVHGDIGTDVFDTRTSAAMAWGASPYSKDELLAMSALEAAALISHWRPDATHSWGIGARELARTLEAVVKEQPREWTDAISEVVKALREPVYVDHYFRALKDEADKTLNRATMFIDAVRLVRASRWSPTPLGSDSYDFDADWSNVDRTVIDVIGAYANKSAAFSPDDIAFAWEIASEMVRDLPGELPGLEVYEDAAQHDDPLNRAVNRPYGHALEALLALGGWEHRELGAATKKLVGELDFVLGVPGAVGAELRAVLASRRPFLEIVAADWMATHAEDLFGNSPLGVISFDQTLKWSRPTKWFYDHFHAELLAAAKRGAENAVSWLLIAYLWSESNYTFKLIVGRLAGDVPAIKSVAEELAHLVTTIDDDTEMFERGVHFIEQMLAADRGMVPASALEGVGVWAMVQEIDDKRWVSLMDQTIALTGGAIEMAIEVADRCKKAQPTAQSLRVLRLMIGHGEPWEQRHIEDTALEALRAAAKEPTPEEFRLLRTRLIERGRHEAAEIDN